MARNDDPARWGYDLLGLDFSWEVARGFPVFLRRGHVRGQASHAYGVPRPTLSRCVRKGLLPGEKTTGFADVSTPDHGMRWIVLNRPVGELLRQRPVNASDYLALLAEARRVLHAVRDATKKPTGALPTRVWTDVDVMLERLNRLRT
jgi:hypothetical protein